MKATWTSPSNIALIKYWGKKIPQLPLNSSISLTLKNSVTKMTIERLISKDELEVNFLFENRENAKFSKKIYDYLLTITNDFPWLMNSKLVIKTENTFPHSSGIASSASSMSALALCLLSIDEEIRDQKFSNEIFFDKASYYARLASGSACRSVFPAIALWKKESELATSFTDVDPLFLTLRDSILIVDEKEKDVSSRAGHSLMENHPYKNSRYLDAENNLEKLKNAMREGDFTRFTEVVEHEALSLHALMLTSTPSVILLKPESLELILKIREWRKTKNIPVAFTIDAGPNIHLLYPEYVSHTVKEYLDKTLWSGKKIIHDEMGQGPVKL